MWSAIQGNVPGGFVDKDKHPERTSILKAQDKGKPYNI